VFDVGANGEMMQAVGDFVREDVIGRLRPARPA
jgi:hypothetical protein